jgi:hypothetical protein
MLQHWSSGLLITALENLLKLMLVHSDLWLQAGKLPHAVNFCVIMLVRSMAVSLQLDFLALCGCVHNVCGTELVVTNHFGIGDALPACGTKQVLGGNAWVAQEIIVSYHGHEVCGGHGGPAGLSNVGVVNKKGWCDDGSQAGPVLWLCR